MGFHIVVGLVAVLAGGIASIAGFGIGSLLTPLLASQYDMKTAVGAVSIPHVIATALRFWKLRGNVDLKVLWGFGVMNACGALLGAIAHSRVGGPVLTIILGILLVFAGTIGLLGYADKLRFGRTAAWIAGALSGAFGGLVGNQGGIRSAAMLGLGIQGPTFVATATAIGLAVDAVRMPIYFATELGNIFRLAGNAGRLNRRHFGNSFWRARLTDDTRTRVSKDRVGRACQCRYLLVCCPKCRLVKANDASSGLGLSLSSGHANSAPV